MLTSRNPFRDSLFALLAVAIAAPALAADKPAKTAKDGEAFQKPEPTRYLRVMRNAKKEPTSMDTAVVRYVPANGKAKLAVDLVGAVHVGDKKYYDDLNTLFEKYDVVLYELVAPKGTRIGKKERENSTFAAVVKSILELESQIQRIDYTKKNFVHADMSPAEMAKAMEKRGDTAFSLFASVFTEMMREQNRRMNQANKGGRKIPQISIATLLFDNDRASKLKRVMAEEFDAEDPSTSLGGTLNTLLIKDRNKACMKVLDEQIKKGHKKIAIFYGAAHMPDFETRLLKDFGLKRKSVDWIQAWEIK